MIHASLFTGIGGFDLAAEWMGWENSFQCEIDPFCQKVLAKNFPHADRYTDIKQFNASKYRGTIDVLSGGFPCQPFSLAGQRKGNQDDRALWPEMLRIIDECRPRWIVGENVAGLVSLGLDGVLFDLEASGYTVQTVLLPACSVGAPHRRDRLWILAHANGLPTQRFGGRERVAGTAGESEGNSQERQWDGYAAGNSGKAIADSESQQGGGCEQRGVQTNTISSVAANANKFDADRAGLCTGGLSQQQKASLQSGFYADPNSQRREECQCIPLEDGAQEPAGSRLYGTANKPDFRLTEPPLCGPDDGLPAGLVRVSTRAKQLKAYGNSIVPQVAYEIFKAIQAVEETLSPVTV